MSFPALFYVALLVCLSSVFLRGQEAGERRYLSAEIANDVFYLPLKTDRYFTSGLRVEWGKERVRTVRQLGGNRVVNQRYWRVDQDLFTPNAIDSLELMPNDRPFASYLTLARGHLTRVPGLGFRFRRQWSAGVLGRPSFGGRMQNAFHGMIDFAEEIPGWVHEVRPDVVLNGLVAVEKELPLGRYHRFTLATRARLGTLYTDFRQQATVTLRPVRFGPDEGVYLRLTAGGNLVGYNATLSGGLLNRDGRYRGVVRPRRLVGNLGATAGVTALGLGVEGGIRWLSPEFHGGMEHLWAWFGVKIR